MLSIIVLGTAAGGGVPQWNCGCDNCRAARNGHPELKATQASIAVSADRRALVPDQRLARPPPADRRHPGASPARGLRHSPIAGVILTNGEVDAIAGLLTLREGSPFTIYGHERVLSLLAENSHLQRAEAGARAARRHHARTPRSSRCCRRHRRPASKSWPSSLPARSRCISKEADDRSTPKATRSASSSATRPTASSFVFLAACAEITPEVAAHLNGASLVFFDGTLWRDDEMIALGLGQKTGQRMGHIAMDAGRSPPSTASASAANSSCTSTIRTRPCSPARPSARRSNTPAGRSRPMGWRSRYDCTDGFLGRRPTLRSIRAEQLEAQLR